MSNPIVESIAADGRVVADILRNLAELETTDEGQILVRLSQPGQKTIILGVEAEDYEPDGDLTFRADVPAAKESK